jgi:hypothetical protein
MHAQALAREFQSFLKADATFISCQRKLQAFAGFDLLSELKISSVCHARK